MPVTPRLATKPGQFASLATERGYTYVKGVDFSPTAIKMARERNPDHKNKFFLGDILIKDNFDVDYDVAVLCEVLEHINDDIGVLNNIEPGKHVIATLPPFDSAGHVRMFKTVGDVAYRYGSMFGCSDIFKIDILNTYIFLISGVIL